MARLSRLAIAELPHQVIASGRDGQSIFIDDQDRLAYLLALRRLTRECGVALHAYALLERDVRLLVTPRAPADLSRLMQRLARGHVARFNRRHHRSGSLWDGRFRATVLEPEPYLLMCMRCIEEEPVHLGLVARAEDYRWSSAAHHRGVNADAAIVEHASYWSLGNTPFEREAAYRSYCERAPADRDRELILAATLKGWGLGSASFLRDRASELRRRLQPMPRGRPRAAQRVPT